MFLFFIARLYQINKYITGSLKTAISILIGVSATYPLRKSQASLYCLYLQYTSSSKSVKIVKENSLLLKYCFWNESLLS